MASFARLVKSKTGQNIPGKGAALKAWELPVMFAGREQWVRNLEGRGGDALPDWLQDVTMESIVTDASARALITGRLKSKRTHARDFWEWGKLVPYWAYDVRDELARRGVPFSVELLASPEINISGGAPLFADPDSQPTSLFQLGVKQVSERSYLRSLGAIQLMLEVWPHFWRLYHRAAGAPVPAGYEAGLTFGSPWLDTRTGVFRRSPIMETPSYAAWSAAGQPA